jgi:hypothetical protein
VHSRPGGSTADRWANKFLEMRDYCMNGFSKTRIVLISLIVIAIVIGGLLYIFDSSLRVDLVLNLIVEVLGIAITVLIIDNVISTREESRWIPIKQQNYADIIMWIDKLFKAVVPVSQIIRDIEVWSFGSASAIITTTLKPYIVTEDYGYNAEPQYLQIIDYEELKTLQKELNNIIQISIKLGEPELLVKLNRINRSLETEIFINGTSDERDISTIKDTMCYVLFYSELIMLNLRKLANQKKKFSEWKDEVILERKNLEIIKAKNRKKFMKL